MYLTYAEYQSMGGTLSETEFENFEFEARSLIDWYTFNRLNNETEYPEAVKRCVFKLIQLVQAKGTSLPLGNASTGTATIASQSNDGVSIRYNVMSASQLFDSVKRETGEVIQRCLNGVVNSLGHRLLYRGVYADE